jgi:hypothetical protein
MKKKKVFKSPGGPHSSAPFGIFAPKFVNCIFVKLQNDIRTGGCEMFGFFVFCVFVMYILCELIE